MSSYGAQSIGRRDRVPAQSQIAVFMLLPADDCPTFFGKETRDWKEQFLTGAQTYTVKPDPSNGPPGSIEMSETVNLPYPRLFVHTLHRKEKDYYDDLSDVQKETLRNVYDTTRQLYRKHPAPEPLPSEWDARHSAAYRTAFSEATEMYKEELSEIALNPIIMTATQLVDVVTRRPSLRDPVYNFHEILPQDLSDGDRITATFVNSSEPAIAAPPDQVVITDLVMPDSTGGFAWVDGGTTCR